MKKCTYICDRCGKEATVANCTQGNVKFWGADGGADRDLCFECVEALKVFLNSKPKNQSKKP